jgi:predicted signal transduction protein with EAL and GGDEF domain
MDTKEDLYKNADDALYEAKERGRNCIMLRNSDDKTTRLVETLPLDKMTGRR